MKTPFTDDPAPLKATVLAALGFTEAQFEDLARDIWSNFPEASRGATLQCVRWQYAEWIFTFVDTEDNFGIPYDQFNPARKLTGRKTTRLSCLAAVASFVVMKMRGDFKGIPISDLTDAGEYDADAADAIAQIAILGEVIYG